MPTTTRLESVCDLITDGKHGDCEPEEGSGYFFLSCKDVKGGRLIYENARQITREDFLQTHKRTQLEPFDILISNSGTIGRMALAPYAEITSRTTFQKSVAILKPNKKQVHYHWLYYYLQCVRDRLISFAGGTAQKNLLLRDLRAFEIEIPTRSIQKTVASVLSAYDDLIENNRRRIEILEEMVRLIYREWFVHFRFPGHENVKLINSPLSEIPEGWEVATLADMAEVNRKSIRKGNAPERIKYVDIASVSPGQINKIEEIDFDDAPSRARRVVRHGDTIWSAVRPNRRSFALVLDPPPHLIVSTGFAVLTPTSVPYTFLYQAVTTDAFVSYLTNHATGAAYPAVNAGDFERAELLRPPKKLFEWFHEIVEPMDVAKQNFQRRIAVLQKTRDLLLPRLISGELDVSELPIETGADDGDGR